MAETVKKGIGFARAATMAVLCLAVVAGGIYFPFLTALNSAARFAVDTRDTHFPEMLEHQRTVINVEKLGRYAWIVYAGKNADERRRARLAAQVLSVDTSFERDPQIHDSVSQVFKDILKLEALRDAQDRQGRASDPLAQALLESIEQRTRVISDDISLAASTAAAEIATRIVENSRRAKLAAFLSLGVLIAMSAALGYLFRRHILRPILQATEGLKTAEVEGRRVTLPPVRIRELQAVTDAVERLSLVLVSHRELNNELERLTLLDPLTQVGNRRFFELQLKKELSRASRHNRPIALLLIDIDHFKPYNDRYGHLRGDVTLKAVAEALSKAAQRPDESLSRIGGEEFAIVLPETGLEAAQAAAHHLLEVVEGLDVPHEASPVAPRVTISIGVCVGQPTVETTLESFCSAADAALYLAKNGGRNAFRAVPLPCSDKRREPSLSPPGSADVSTNAKS